jgi:L-amino acid N-acyltransferase YncA
MSKLSKYTRDFNGMSYRCGYIGKTYVAEYEGEIAGFNYYSILKTKDYTNFYFVYINQKFSKQGIGSKLFLQALENSRNAGKKYMIWSVHYTNIPSINMFKRMGFEPYSKVSTYYKYKAVLNV